MQWAHHENYVLKIMCLAPETRPISFAESEGYMSSLFPDTQGGYLNNRGKKRIGCEVVEISASSSTNVLHTPMMTRSIMVCLTLAWDTSS
jgi:hypothetical protein